MKRCVIYDENICSVVRKFHLQKEGVAVVFFNKIDVQIPFRALFGQKVKGGIWFPKIDT